MSISVPNSSSVSSSFRKALKRIEAVKKKINIAAAHETKAGNYEIAKEWMDVGRSVTDFRDRTEAFSKEWKTLVRGIRTSNRGKVDRAATLSSRQVGIKRPFVWRFCTPILGIVVARGGSASSEEVMSDIENTLGKQLTDRDRSVSTRTGLPKWHVGLKKAYKQCQREGWIERRRDGVWKVTTKGKTIADRKD